MSKNQKENQRMKWWTKKNESFGFTHTRRLSEKEEKKAKRLFFNFLWIGAVIRKISIL